MKQSHKLASIPILGFVLAIMFVMTPLQKVTAQTYCNPTYSPQGNSWMITQFSIPEADYSISISNWNQTNNTSELILVTPGEEYTFQITTTGWIGVGVAADFNNDGDFEDEGEILAEPTYMANNPANYVYTITIPEDLEDGNYRLRLWNALANAGNGNPPGSPCGAYSYGTFADFTLVVGTCFTPMDIQVSNVTQTQASISWTSFGPAESWNIEYGEAGFELGEGILINDIDENQFDLIDLEANTTYDVYLQSDCIDDGTSGWAGPISFTTHFVSVPIEVTGFNEDVIANGIGPMASSTTNTVDNTNFCFLSEDWQLDIDSPALTVGLPEGGLIISNPVEGSGVTYQMSPFSNPYEGNNSLRIATTDTSGSLELVAPATYKSLFFLVTSGGGSSTIEILVNFDDGSSQIFMSQNITDWHQTGSIPIELSGIGRGNVNTDVVETPTNNPKLFRLTADIASINHNKPITSINFIKTGGNGVVNIFAVSGIEGDEIEEVCEPIINFSIDQIDTTSINVSWEEPENTDNIENYGWIVVLEGNEPFEDLHVAEGFENVGQTTASIDGLVSGETYDIYFMSVCDLGEMFFSDFVMETFTTETLSIQDVAFFDFQFFPNPSTDYIHLQASENIQQVQLYTINGKELRMLSGTVSPSMKIDIENYPQGVYFMKVTIGNQSKTFKIIKK